MKVFRLVAALASLSLFFAAPLGATQSTDSAQAERADRLAYFAYAAGAVLVAVIVAGVLVDTEDSVSP